jgi:RNA polymerase sigma factor (sigma-70 family)
LLRLRSDEQLVSLFRAGNEEAFRMIHDRYRQRLHAYARQMLAASAADAEDVVQEIFVRVYGSLRSSDRELALRAWLYRIAHNRCIDEIRRPQPIATEAIEELTATAAPDPMARIEQRDALRRLIADVRRLPEQQRSALLMRELGGMPYADVAEALTVSVPAVKSLLVRARVGLAQAGEARDTACARIREDLIISHDRGVRTSGLARRHMRDCRECRHFRSEVRGVSRQFAGLIPALGPIGVVAKLLGVGGAGGGGAAASTGAVATSGAVGTGAVISVGAVTAGAGHVVTLLAAAVVTAGGAIELQQVSRPAHHAHHRHVVRAAPARATPRSPLSQVLPTASAPAATTSQAPDIDPPATTTATSTAAPRLPRLAGATISGSTGTSSQPTTAAPRHPLPISEVIDPDNLNSPRAGNPTAGTNPPSTTTPGSTGTLPTTTGTVPTTSTPTIGSTPTTGTGAPAPTGSTGTVPTTTGTSPTTTTTPTTSTTGSGQPSTGLTPLTQTSKTSGTDSASGGAVALSATGSSTKRGAVRVYKSTRH